MTKVEFFDAVIANNITEEVIEKAEAMKASELNAAAKAKERKAAKAAEPDAIMDAVAAQLTSEPQTAQDIADAIGDEEVTKAKVVARLTKLINAGKAAKDQVKVEGQKGKVTVYTVA